MDGLLDKSVSVWRWYLWQIRLFPWDAIFHPVGTGIEAMIFQSLMESCLKAAPQIRQTIDDFLMLFFQADDGLLYHFLPFPRPLERLLAPSIP